MPNLLQQAADNPNRDEAIGLIATALGIELYPKGDGFTTKDGTRTGISWPARWRALDRCSRLREISDWLKAECFDLMELVEARTPMQTVGTND